MISKAVHIAIGITNEGTRKIIGLMIKPGESLDTWESFFDHPKDRGLKGLKMIISDAYKGLVNAIKESFVNVSWQRCIVHFLRNILTKAPKNNTEKFREDIKMLFRIQEIDLTRKMKEEIFNKYENDKRFTKSLEALDEGFEDGFTYLTQDNIHSRLRTTNCLERLNEEIRRRERVVRIFPNNDSAIRLIGSILIDINEEWISSGRAYIKI